MVRSESESDSDSEQRERILKKLTQYGDSLLQEKEHEKRKKKTASSLSTTALPQARRENLHKGRRWKKQQKKKMAAQSVEQLEEDMDRPDKTATRTSGKSGENRHLAFIREKLGLDECHRIPPVGSSNEEKSSQPSPVSEQEEGKRRPPQVIVFNDPAKRKERKGELIQLKRPHKERLEEEEEDDNVQPEHELLSLKHDVKMFGIRAMTKESGLKARQRHLIELGAKAPKRPYVNYRELQAKRKIELEEEKKKQQRDIKLGMKVTKTKQRNKRRNEEGPLDGQVGRYEHGVLHVDRTSLQGSRPGQGRGRGKRR